MRAYRAIGGRGKFAVLLVLTLPLLVGGAAVVGFTGVKFRDVRCGAVEVKAMDSPAR